MTAASTPCCDCLQNKHNARITVSAISKWTVLPRLILNPLSAARSGRVSILRLILLGNGVRDYLVLSRFQNAGRSHNIKIDNSSFERVEEFKYLRTILRNENSIQEEIKSRLKYGNACCHAVQNPLSSSLLSKNVKIKIYRIIILPVVLYGCETWSLTLR
jgi:hypothetical protein